MENKITKLRSYRNRKLYLGRGIRWMIENDKGERIYCFHCGNLANSAVVSTRGENNYQIPMCKKHYSEIDKEATSVPSCFNYVKPVKTYNPEPQIISPLFSCY